MPVYKYTNKQFIQFIQCQYFQSFEYFCGVGIETGTSDNTYNFLLQYNKFVEVRFVGMTPYNETVIQMWFNKSSIYRVFKESLQRTCLPLINIPMPFDNLFDMW